VLEILSDATGVIIAGSILFAAREMRRISNALRDLDLRVSRLESVWMHGKGVQQRPGQSTDDPFAIEVRSRDRKSGGPGSGSDC